MANIYVHLTLLSLSNKHNNRRKNLLMINQSEIVHSKRFALVFPFNKRILLANVHIFIIYILTRSQLSCYNLLILLNGILVSVPPVQY